MSTKNEKAIYKLNFDCGRNGELDGVFVAKKSHVKILIDSGMEVYFGEVLGKHSEIYGPITSDEITLVTDEEKVVKLFEEHNIETGYNPFDFDSMGEYVEKYGDLSVLEIVEIIEKEENK